MMQNLPTRMLHLLNPFVPTVLKARLAAGSGAARGHDPRPGHENRDHGFAGHGLVEHRAVPALPPRPQPRRVLGPREAGRGLLGLLVETFVRNGPLVTGMDETLEEALGQEVRCQ